MRKASALLALPAAVAVLALPTAASSRPVVVRAPLTRCTVGLEPAQRTLTVHPQMRPIAGTVRMGIRLALYERTPVTGRFVHVPGADGFDTWRKSEKGVGEYDLFQTLDTLAAPASYRMRVGFRWYGKHARVLRTVTRLTPKCAEPDLRPNLLVKSIIVTAPVKPDRPWHYAVIVRNVGLSPAGPFAVSFSGGGAPPVAPLSKTVTGLAPNTQTQVNFAGPACAAAAPPSALVDSLSQVSERNETDNRGVAVC